MSFDMTNVLEIEEALEKIVLELFNFGYSKDGINTMFQNALKEGTESE